MLGLSASTSWRSGHRQSSGAGPLAFSCALAVCVRLVQLGLLPPCVFGPVTEYNGRLSKQEELAAVSDPSAH